MNDVNDSAEGHQAHPHQVGRGVVVGAPMTPEAEAARALDAARQPAEQTARPRGLSLAFKLLALTLGFVLLAEVLIFLPSIGRAQRDYLQDRLAFGHLAILALDAAPDGMVGPQMQSTLLTHAEAHLVAVRRQDGTNSVLNERPITAVNRQIILNQLSFIGGTLSALNTLITPSDGQIRVVGDSPKTDSVEVEVVMEAAPLRGFLVDFAARVAWLSLFISGLTASLIYGVLIFLIVRPVERMSKSMRLFAEDPEDQRFDQAPPTRRDELGEAERQFVNMRNAVRQAFHQKSRLAALGTGLTKITHDLRNVMSTTVLLSDGLESSQDPMVQRVAPKLSREISRAEALCLATVTYATDGPVRLVPDEFDLSELLHAVAERFESQVQRVTVLSDGPQLFLGDRAQLDRVFDNLVRNAVQMGASEVALALTLVPTAPPQTGALKWRVTVTDNGPGLPPRAKEHLFAPFAGSARKGGTGLGLPLSRDIVRAHGGELSWLPTEDGAGTQFAVDLPS